MLTDKNHNSYSGAVEAEALSYLKNRTYANRGKSFEELINLQNECYHESLRAMVQKIPTKFIPLRNHAGKIVSVKVEEKSTVDYVGRYKNRPIAFEAKHCSGDTAFAFSRVELHQAAFLDDWCSDGNGIGFILVSFGLDRIFLIPWDAYKAAKAGTKGEKHTMCDGSTWLFTGKASVRPNELPPTWEVKSAGYCDYLRIVERLWRCED